MAANRAGSGAPYRAPRRRTAGDVVNDILNVVARIAAVVFILALAFSAFAVFSGSLRDYPAGYTPALAMRLASNAQMAGTALVASSGVLAICVVALLWGWEWAWLLLLGTGALFYAGLPHFGASFMSEAARATGRFTQPGAIILNAWRNAGFIYLGAGALFLAGWAWEQLQVSLTASRRAGGGIKVPFYSACWQSHYCKSEIARLCVPGRKGFRKSCWRHKSGCFCDESIGDQMLASARAHAGKDAEKWLGPAARPPAPTFGDHFRSTRFRVANQRIACADCPIYNFHEMQKHRILAPVILISIPALMFYFGEGLHLRYRLFVAHLDRYASGLAFSPGSTQVLTRQINGAFGEPAVEYMVYALVCMLLLTLAARALEYWCFQAKL